MGPIGHCRSHILRLVALLAFVLPNVVRAQDSTNRVANFEIAVDDAAVNPKPDRVLLTSEFAEELSEMADLRKRLADVEGRLKKRDEADARR